MPIIQPETTDYPLGVKIERCFGCSVRYTEDLHHCLECHGTFESWKLYSSHRKKGPKCYKPSQMEEPAMKIDGGVWRGVRQ